MLVQSKLILTLLVGGASYYTSSAADIHGNARQLYAGDAGDNGNEDGPYASDDEWVSSSKPKPSLRTPQESHYSKSGHSKSGKGGGSKGSKGLGSKGSKSSSSSSSSDGSKDRDGPNNCNELMHYTCCNQRSSVSDDVKERICEELGCSFDSCGDEWSSSSWSGDEHDDEDFLKKRLGTWKDDGHDDRSVDFPPKGNEFQPARKGDIRSPCPAINTLANHGFIARNGKNIDVVDLAQQLENVYRVSATTLMNGPVDSAIALNLTVPFGDKNLLTIDQLFQNRDSTFVRNPDRDIGTKGQEHDSSYFREDADLLLDRAPSARLVHKFFEVNDGLRLDPVDLMEYQRMRIKESCARHEEDHPDTTRPYTAGARGGMAIQSALLFVLGQAQIGPNFNRVSSNLRTIVADEMLPDGYDPDGDVLLTFADGCESDDLRDAFRANVDQAICDFCPEDDAFPCDNLEPVPIITFPLSGEC